MGLIYAVTAFVGAGRVSEEENAELTKDLYVIGAVYLIIGLVVLAGSICLLRGLHLVCTQLPCVLLNLKPKLSK